MFSDSLRCSLFLLCSPTFSYLFLSTLLLRCLSLHLTFHLHIPHHLIFSRVPSFFFSPSCEHAILCSLSLTAGFHLPSDIVSSLMLSHDSISKPTGSSLLSCRLPSPLLFPQNCHPLPPSPLLSSLPPDVFLPLFCSSPSSSPAAAAASHPSLSFISLSLLPNASLCYLKTKDGDEKMVTCACPSPYQSASFKSSHTR